MANKIVKTLPSTLEAEQQYAVRARSINGLGVPSSWSESTIVDTTAAGLASARRLVINNDGMVAYDSNGRIIFNYASSTPAIRTNFVTNPSFEENTTGWSALANSAISRITSDFFFGQVEAGRKASLEVSAPVPSSNVGFVTAVGQRITATGGLAYTASVYTKIPVGQPKASFKVGLRFYDLGGSLIAERVSSIAKELDSTQNWVRLSLIGVTAPSGTAKMGFVAYATSQMTAGSKWIVDGVLVEQSSILRDYFDGSTSTGTSAWTGVANNSSSTLDTNSTYSVNGGVFTESVIQTSRADFTGVKITKDGIRGYAPGATPIETFFLDAATGALSINGAGLPGGDSVPVGGAATDVNTNGTTIQGGKIRTGLIQSTSYSGVTDGSAYSSNGTTYNLDNGSITSKFFRIDTSGNAFFSGSLAGASGTFSGTVSGGSISGGTIDIGGADSSSFHVDAGGNMWLGSATYGAAPFRVSNTGALIVSGSLNSITISTNGVNSTIAFTGNLTSAITSSGNFGISSVGQIYFSTSDYLSVASDKFIVTTPYGSIGLGVSGLTLGSASNAGTMTIAGSGAITFTGSSFYVNSSVTSTGTVYGNVIQSGNYMVAKSGSPSAFNSNACGYTFGSDNDTGLFNDSDGILTFGVNGTTAMTFNAPATGVFLSQSFLQISSGTHALRWDNVFGQITIQASSAKYKENINSLETLDIDRIIKSARPVQFNWKARNKETKKQKEWRKWEVEYGFLVEELSEIDPHLVHWGATDEGELEPVSWDPSVMCAVLMSAVQKLTSRIEELESNM